MAEIRTQALSIQNTEGVNDYLAVEYGKVIENVASLATSNLIKNTDLSGDPTAGSVVARRFVNAERAAYGTARAAGKGKNVKAGTVIVPIDKHWEYIEEVEEADVRFYGTENILNRRLANIQRKAVKDLDRDFYTVMTNAGTEFVSTETDILLRVNKAVAQLKNTHNEFVDGVDGDLISIIANPFVYDEIRTKLQALPSYPGLTTQASVGNYHNSKLIESTELPAGVDFIVQVDGSVALPAHFTAQDFEKIPLSKAYSFGLFLDCGCVEVTPDLILVAKAVSGASED